MDIRSSSELFEDLIDLNADEWNITLSKELGIPIDQLKSMFMMRDKINITQDKVSVLLNKEIIKRKGELQKSRDDITIHEVEDLTDPDPGGKLSIPTKLDKYTIRVRDNDTTTESITCTGKIIVGMDFTRAELDNSFFCHCTFYNCDFTEADLANTAFQTCTFNTCYFTKTDLNNSTFTRTTFLDCYMDNSMWGYSVISDGIFISTQLSYSDFRCVTLINVGFSDCSSTKSDWGDSKLISSIFTSCNLSESKFISSTLKDIMLIKTILLGCDFDNAVISVLTATSCEYAPKYQELFKLNHFIFTPSVMEWNDEDNNGDE